MIAYKLLRVRKDGTLGPLFINRSQVIPLHTWLPAECHPTGGFQVRKGWHATPKPHAPHLSMAPIHRRRWYRVDLRDTTFHSRPECQGGQWILAQSMRVISPC